MFVHARAPSIKNNGERQTCGESMARRMRKSGFPSAAGAEAVEEGLCKRWLGIPKSYAARIIVLGVLGGAAMETFMVKVWIGQTNFYEVVKRKEAEKRLDSESKVDSSVPAAPSFGELVRTQVCHPHLPRARARAAVSLLVPGCAQWAEKREAALAGSAGSARGGPSSDGERRS